MRLRASDWDELSGGLLANHFTVDNLRYRLDALRTDRETETVELNPRSLDDVQKRNVR